MGLLLSEALNISPLNRCNIVAGHDGLNTTIISVNSFDAPDVIPWLKAGELVLTTGYVFKNDELALIELVRELANRKCAGLGLKTKHFQDSIKKEMFKLANELHFPIIEIPDGLSIADLVLTVLREIFSKQNKNIDTERKKLFFTRLLNGELHGKDAILSGGRAFGLIPRSSYICLCVDIKRPRGSFPAFKDRIIEKAEELAKSLGNSVIIVELTEIVIIIQGDMNEATEVLHTEALQMANDLIDSLKHDDPKEEEVTVSIGTRNPNVLGIQKSYQNAKEALMLGSQLFPHSRHPVYDYADLKNYALLQQIPVELLNNYYTEILDPLINYDQENQSDLLETLSAYLSCCGRPTETAQFLQVHRNTIHHRLSRIKELLKTELDDGETLFRLNLALRIFHLLKKQSKKDMGIY